MFWNKIYSSIFYSWWPRLFLFYLRVLGGWSRQWWPRWTPGSTLWSSASALCLPTAQTPSSSSTTSLNKFLNISRVFLSLVHISRSVRPFPVTPAWWPHRQVLRPIPDLNYVVHVLVDVDELHQRGVIQVSQQTRQIFGANICSSGVSFQIYLFMSSN